MYCQALRFKYFGRLSDKFDGMRRTRGEYDELYIGLPENFFEGKREMKYKCPLIDKYVNHEYQTVFETQNKL